MKLCMVKQLAAEVVFARRGGKLTPRHAMHLAKLKTRAEDTGGRATARSLCSGGFLPPPPAHLGRAGVATPAEACPPCAGLAAFGAACSTARASRVRRIVARRCVVAGRQRLERYAQPPPLARPSRREICGRVQAAQDSGHCEMEPPLRKRRKTGGASSTRPSVALSSCCLTGSPRRSCTRLTGGDELQDAGWLASTLSSRRYSHV